MSSTPAGLVCLLSRLLPHTTTLLLHLCSSACRTKAPDMCVVQKPLLACELALLPPSERPLPTWLSIYQGHFVRGERVSLWSICSAIWPWWAELRPDMCARRARSCAEQFGQRAQQPRGYLSGPADWSISPHTSTARAGLALLHAALQPVVERYRLTAGSSRADPRKTTGNVSDAGASMMHDTDEDKVTTTFNLVEKDHTDLPTPTRPLKDSAAPSLC